MNRIFNIISNNQKVGISVAPTEELALAFARKALTRQTVSKEDSEPEYPNLTAEPFEPIRPAPSAFVKKLLSRISTVANSRFAEA